MQPLNPTLYSNLKRLFGQVKVSNQGLACVNERYVFNTLKGREERQVDEPGEYYLVNCDHCSDTRHRLQINHRFGRRDVKGFRNLHLIICFNNGCYSAYEERLDLYDRLCEIDGVLDHAEIRPGIELAEPRKVEMPGPVYNLADLPPYHPANRYLAGRFYDPEMLGEYYRVGYCPQSFYTMAANRIIIPIYRQRALKGWQARYIGDLDWHGPNKKELPPKYFSCPGMSRSALIYNLDNARHFQTVVVMEGPADVWSLGPMGVATFGFPMTAHQVALLAPLVKDRTIVFLFDPDVLEQPKTKAAYAKLRAHVEEEAPFGRGSQVAWINPPGNYDPGDMDRIFLREFIVREAAKQDIKVSWRRIS